MVSGWLGLNTYTGIPMLWTIVGSEKACCAMYVFCFFLVTYLTMQTNISPTIVSTKSFYTTDDVTYWNTLLWKYIFMNKLRPHIYYAVLSFILQKYNWWCIQEYHFLYYLYAFPVCWKTEEEEQWYKRSSKDYENWVYLQTLQSVRLTISVYVKNTMYGTVN